MISKKVTNVIHYLCRCMRGGHIRTDETRPAMHEHCLQRLHLSGALKTVVNKVIVTVVILKHACVDVAME